MHRIAERANAAGDDRNLLHGIDAGQARSNERMAHLVIGDPSALVLAEQPALLFDPRHDTLDGNREIVEGNLVGLSPGRGNGSLIDQVGNVGASEASS